MDFLSKLKQRFSSVTSNKDKKNLKRISLNQAIKHISITNTHWVFAGLFMLFLLIIFLAMTISMRQTMQHASHQEVVGHIKIHGQRLAKASQQTIAGNKIAFIQLKDSRDRINRYLTLLMQGGITPNNHIAPVSDKTSAMLLGAYNDNWKTELKKVNLILRSEKTLVDLGRVVDEINVSNIQLMELIDQLTIQMQQAEKSPNELIAAEAMKVLTQNVTKSINTVLPNKSPAADIVAQLSIDRKRFLAIITALDDNDKGLHVSSLKNAGTLEILQQIQGLFNIVDDQINILQQEIPEITTTKFAAHALFNNSEDMLKDADTLEAALQQQNTSYLSYLKITIYAASALAVLALFIFIRTLASSINKQLVLKEQTIASTQTAILRLLDDMDKVADGDLTARTLVTEDTTGAIADSINYTVEELQVLVKEVNQASTQVVNTSEKTQSISIVLQKAAQQQTIKIEETTLALLNIAESISRVSDIATESSKVAKQSLIAAKKGSMAVRDSITGMNEIRTSIQETSKRIKRLGESSQEIGEIITLISDVTEQTNTLALNAAIQATTSGESGNGFSVIAQEVQRLAEQSTQAAEQIGILVNTIQRDTKDTVTAMEKSTLGIAEGAVRSDAAGQALEEIEQVSAYSAKLVTKIFNNTHAQTQATNKVVRNMEAILSVTRQTTNGTIKMATAVKKVAGLASTLKASVSNFKV